MDLSKEQCVFLMKSLKEKNLIEKNIDADIYDKREKEMVKKYYCCLKDGTKYIKDVRGLADWMVSNHTIRPNGWST